MMMHPFRDLIVLIALGAMLVTLFAVVGPAELVHVMLPWLR